MNVKVIVVATLSALMLVACGGEDEPDPVEREVDASQQNADYLAQVSAGWPAGAAKPSDDDLIAVGKAACDAYDLGMVPAVGRGVNDMSGLDEESFAVVVSAATATYCPEYA